jgi:hypothetical protein
VRGTHFLANDRQSHAELRIAELARKQGSVLDLVWAWPSGRRSSTPFTYENTPGVIDFVLENPLPLVNGILPAWLVTAGNFMTLDETGRVKTYQGPMSTLDAADETSIVRPADPSPLNRDLTIHALYGVGSGVPVDLGGHTLTVGSGGVSGAQLTNGRIRPGEHSDGELIFFGSMVAANIVDNTRPTSVTYVGEATVSGENTYTGTTFIIGQPGTEVRIRNAKALPEGGDLEISGWGSLFVENPSEVHYELGTVTIRDGGSFSGRCCDTLSYVSARKIELQSGYLSVAPEGNTPIVKTTDGVARIVATSINDQFVGTVDVYDGLLIAGGDQNRFGYLALGQADVTVHPNGRLALHPASTDLSPRPIAVTLNGGALYTMGNSQASHVNLVGNIDVVADSKLYMFHGTAMEPKDSNMRINGRINVAAGKTLEVLGRANYRFGGELEVSDGIHLEPGAVLAGDGAFRGRIDIDDGAVLSPGTISSGVSVGSIAMNGSVFVADPKSMMVWGVNGRYRWEINDATGEPGAIFGKGWDTVYVRGELHIGATIDSPFHIELVGLNSPRSDHGAANLTNGQYRWQLVEAEAIFGFDPSKFVIDATRLLEVGSMRRASTWLTREGNSIYINALVVPEPRSVVLLASALALVLAVPRRFANWLHPRNFRNRPYPKNYSRLVAVLFQLP